MPVETLRLVVNRKALVRACARAAQSSVARGGVYDVRGSALVVWPGPWSAIPMRPSGEPLGMVTWEWGVPAEQFATVTRVEAAEGQSTETVLGHLRRLLSPRPSGPVTPGDEYG
jgi:hypothetical protein